MWAVPTHSRGVRSGVPQSVLRPCDCLWRPWKWRLESLTLGGRTSPAEHTRRWMHVPRKNSQRHIFFFFPYLTCTIRVWTFANTPDTVITIGDIPHLPVSPRAFLLLLPLLLL